MAEAMWRGWPLCVHLFHSPISPGSPTLSIFKIFAFAALSWEHFTVVLPVRILFIYWDEAQPSSLLEGLLVRPQLKGPSPCILLNLPSTPSHLLTAWPHPSTDGCHWHLFASFSLSLWVLALEGRDYTLLLTHLRTESGPLSPPSLAQFCSSSISQVDSYSDSL